mmetsp:Transcript_16665/g.29966  ORF Transcript_16665/g.29966 Transcript_16665/m.29966 type:complete len:212 (-) Transcript_16665:1438-2073(-)
MRRAFSNLYKVLEVDVEAHSEAIKKAYYKLAKKYHPDTQGTGNPESFKKVTDAYKILSNPTTRQQYDNSSFQDTEEQPRRENPGQREDNDPFINTHRFSEDDYMNFQGKVESMYTKAFDADRQRKYKDFKREEFYDTPPGPMTHQMRDRDRRDSSFGILVYSTVAMIILNVIRMMIPTKQEKALEGAWNEAYERELTKVREDRSQKKGQRG